MNAEFKVLGLELQNEVGLDNCKAIRIDKILESYKISDLYKLEAENADWLERINNIHKTEFELIGTGAYGKVL